MSVVIQRRTKCCIENKSLNKYLKQYLYSWTGGGRGGDRFGLDVGARLHLGDRPRPSQRYEQGSESGSFGRIRISILQNKITLKDIRNTHMC